MFFLYIISLKLFLYSLFIIFTFFIIPFTTHLHSHTKYNNCHKNSIKACKEQLNVLEQSNIESNNAIYCSICNQNHYSNNLQLAYKGTKNYDNTKNKTYFLYHNNNIDFDKHNQYNYHLRAPPIS